ncbi:hypothetical protein E4U09_005030 [Claviceps aff. purpurea]|uniref:Uncharacterized protein n=1 Tax=Claviceps aff. purpurea TaxID=1967640 RepID=A0A9P7U3X2_9HYPO|nr:hypothetical protein E4U09_005030 [Claviceps aff. purpurea]
MKAETEGSKVHNTTFSRVKRVKDPKGYHLTFRYKLQRHIDRKTHMTGHIYVDDPKSLNVTRAKLAPEKDDTAPKADMSKKPDGPTRHRMGPGHERPGAFVRPTHLGPFTAAQYRAKPQAGFHHFPRVSSP